MSPFPCQCSVVVLAQPFPLLTVWSAVTVSHVPMELLGLLIGQGLKGETQHMPSHCAYRTHFIDCCGCSWNDNCATVHLPLHPGVKVEPQRRSRPAAWWGGPPSPSSPAGALPRQSIGTGLLICTNWATICLFTSLGALPEGSIEGSGNSQGSPVVPAIHHSMVH